ncbi:MAG: hypothetical protein GKR94_31150 [Gammaproteobacteria bacterium]|nr:hypothetical protein [Gammaproteobacteria bacterium]
MSAKWLRDREKFCRNAVKAHWLYNGEIWAHIQLSAEEQSKICQDGKATFRVDYGFDRREKSWEFSHEVGAPPCECGAPKCPSDEWYIDGGGRCARLVCENVKLPNREYLEHGEGIYIWEDAIYQAQRPIAHCKFK